MRLRKDVKQNFQYVPYYGLFEKIKYKAAMEGIEVVFTEEAYTSKASFIDHDPLPAYDEGVKPQFSGKRIGRGLYRSGDTTWNADVNGSLNIGRKVIGEGRNASSRKSIKILCVKRQSKDLLAKTARPRFT